VASLSSALRSLLLSLSNASTLGGASARERQAAALHSRRWLPGVTHTHIFNMQYMHITANIPVGLNVISVLSHTHRCAFQPDNTNISTSARLLKPPLIFVFSHSDERTRLRFLHFFVSFSGQISFSVFSTSESVTAVIQKLTYLRG